MDIVLQNFSYAYSIHNGYVLSTTFLPVAPSSNPAWLQQIRASTDPQSVSANIRYALVYNPTISLEGKEADAWLELYVAFYRSICQLLYADDLTSALKNGAVAVADVAKQWGRVYDAWRDVTNLLYRGYSSGGFEAWTVPCLYMIGRYLRFFAIKADDWARQAGGDYIVNGDDGMATVGEDIADTVNENAKLEDCARNVNRLFSLCISDRAPIESSRKWALYQLANLLFKTYFKLNSISLTKNIIRTLEAQVYTPEFPPLTAVPKSHQVTFQYYSGVTAFLDDDYKTADEAFTRALTLMPQVDGRADIPDTTIELLVKNREYILTYLIPVRLLTTGKLPSAALLESSPLLNRLFGSIVEAIRRGDLRGFEEALFDGETEYIERRIFLTLERLRDYCVRNLFRKVYFAAGWEEGQEGQVRRSRIKITEFIAGVRLAKEGRVRKVKMTNGHGERDVDMMNGYDDSNEDDDGERDEVEWMVAQCIYKDLMKGYIAREHGIVVLKKGGAFPGTGI